MTMNKVIEYVDAVKPNVYDNNEKYQWIARLDGMVSAEVHQDEETVVYELPRDADAELLVPAPYDDMYALFVASMIDFYNKEYTNYNNSALMFAERLEQYKAWYIRRHAAGRALNFRNVMG